MLVDGAQMMFHHTVPLSRTFDHCYVNSLVLGVVFGLVQYFLSPLTGTSREAVKRGII